MIRSIAPSGTTANGVPIFTRPSGTAFHLVIEGQPGANHVTVGNSAYDAELLSFPDLQIETSRALGNGSTAVCDSAGSKAGGVPGNRSPQLSTNQIPALRRQRLRLPLSSMAAANPWRGAPARPVPPTAPAPPDSPSSTQRARCSFAPPITKVLQFPDGDTVLTARLQGIDATPGPTAQIVVRIGASPAPATVSPTPTATPDHLSNPNVHADADTDHRRHWRTIGDGLGHQPRRATPTQTPRPLPSSTPSSTLTGPVVTFFGLAYSDNTLVMPDATTTDGLLLYRLANGAGVLARGRRQARCERQGRRSIGLSERSLVAS